MQTQSPVIVAFALTKGLRQKITIPRWPFVLGAFIPDVPLPPLWRWLRRRPPGMLSGPIP